MRHDSNAPRRFYINGELAQETPTQQQQGGAGGRQPSTECPMGNRYGRPATTPMGQPGQPQRSITAAFSAAAESMVAQWLPDTPSLRISRAAADLSADSASGE